MRLGLKRQTGQQKWGSLLLSLITSNSHCEWLNPCPREDDLRDDNRRSRQWHAAAAVQHTAFAPIRRARLQVWVSSTLCQLLILASSCDVYVL